MPAREDGFRVADEMRAAAIRVSIQIVQKSCRMPKALIRAIYGARRADRVQPLQPHQGPSAPSDSPRDHERHPPDIKKMTQNPEPRGRNRTKISKNQMIVDRPDQAESQCRFMQRPEHVNETS